MLLDKVKRGHRPTVSASKLCVCVLWDQIGNGKPSDLFSATAFASKHKGTLVGLTPLLGAFLEPHFAAHPPLPLATKFLRIHACHPSLLIMPAEAGQEIWEGGLGRGRLALGFALFNFVSHPWACFVWLHVVSLSFT